MLEVRSLAAVETTLREHGFFGGDAVGVVADVYLGYGLSTALRRRLSSPPPEPCRLPPAAVRIRPEGDDALDSGGFSIGEWQHTWSPAEHAAAVEAVREAIARGDVYQVNLVQHLSAPFRGDPTALAGQACAAAAAARASDRRRRMGDHLRLARGVSRAQRTAVWTMPIKGTRPVGGHGLTESEKDAAEHVMIVDLERNDLSRVCETGSVTWPELMTERPLAGVEHLVSLLEGTLRENVSLTELLEATFPGGSVTGAPKISAIDHIAELEPVGRGASMGALGTIWPNGDFDLALTIRTFAIADGRVHLWVGGGIVWDSVPHEEIEESLVKARPLLEAIGAALPEPVRA